MKRSRFTEEQIIGVLKEHEPGPKTADLCSKHGISSATFFKRKAKYGGMDVSDASYKIFYGRFPYMYHNKAIGIRAPERSQYARAMTDRLRNLQ